jgi:hypothetical protein
MRYYLSRLSFQRYRHISILLCFRYVSRVCTTKCVLFSFVERFLKQLSAPQREISEQTLRPVFLSSTVHQPAFSLLHSSTIVAFLAMYDLCAWRRSAQSATTQSQKPQIRPAILASPLEGTYPKVDRKQKDTLLGRMDDAFVSYMGKSPFHPTPTPQHCNTHIPMPKKFNLPSAPALSSCLFPHKTTTPAPGSASMLIPLGMATTATVLVGGLTQVRDDAQRKGRPNVLKRLPPHSHPHLLHTILTISIPRQ